MRYVLRKRFRWCICFKKTASTTLLPYFCPCETATGRNSLLLKYSKSIDDTVANRTVDIAFPVTVEKDGTYVFKEAESPFISVYFPTETESKLKFIVQGPYRTTPNRSSVPSDEPENIQLSKITAELLKESIRELRDRNLINLSFLKILPIDENAFRAYDLFKPLYSTVRILLSGDNMLPAVRWICSGK
jgi:hypothetical protein